MGSSGFFNFLRGDSPDQEGDSSSEETNGTSDEEWSGIDWDDESEPELDDAFDANGTASEADSDGSAPGADEAPVDLPPHVEQDAVLSELLHAGVAGPDQLQLAMERNADQPDTALWRTVAELEGIDRDRVFATVADVHDIASVTIDDQNPADAFLTTVQGLLRDGAGRRLMQQGLLPVEMRMNNDTGNLELVLATHDPTRPAYREAARSLQVPATLYYAPEQAVNHRLEQLQAKGALAPEPEQTTDASPSSETTNESPPSSGEPASPDASTGSAPASNQAPWHSATPTPASSSSSGPPAGNSAPWNRLEGEGPDEVESTVPMPSNGAALAEVEEAPEGAMDVQVEEDGSFSPQAIANTLPEHLFSDLDLDVAETLRRARNGMADEVFDSINGTAPAGDGAAPSDGATAEPPEAPGGEAPPHNGSSDSKAEPDPEPEPEPIKEVDPEQIKALRSSDRVVDALLRRDIVTPPQVVQAQTRKDNKGLGDALWRVLADEGDVDREAVYAEAARVYAFPQANLEKHAPDAEFSRSVMDRFNDKQRDQLLDLGVIPLRAAQEGNRGAVKLYLITHDPMRPEVHRITRQLALDRLELQYAPESAVNALIADAFPKKNEYLERIQERGDSVDLGQNYDDDNELVDEEELEAEINRSTLINLFEATLVEAVREGASDIHIYPNADKQVEIHFRIDGRLHHWYTEDKVHPEALLSVIKDNSMNVDRFERDAAQDGFIQRWVDNALIRFRVSIMPIANASQEIRSESIVIRVLDDRKVITDLGKLGLLEGALERFAHAISQPHGMVILTGPTGSGKSTTLVAALHRVISPEVNVLTIEDPVEYIIPGVRQIKLNDKLKLEDALRSILRHDPDVVMVGEMRDRQTAELAIKLANTGHLTFSTLHTNDAPSAVSRLYKMGIEPFLIAYAINLIVAQRLIRKLCPECKRPDPDPDPIMLEQLGFTPEEIESTTFYTEGNDSDCSTCKGLSYKGRRAISEALSFSRPIRHMIVEADGMVDEGAIREQAMGEGMLTLRDSAREVVKMGETSVREMMRVVASEGKTLA